MLTGWVCPKCGKVNAPWKESCDCVITYCPWPLMPWPIIDPFPPPLGTYGPSPIINPVPQTGDPLPSPSYTTCETKNEEE